MQLLWRSRVEGPRGFHPDRRRRPEILDDPALDPREVAASHGDLERIARLPWQMAPLARAAREIARSRIGGAREGQGPRLRLVELGAGTGSAGLAAARALSSQGFLVDLVPTDLRTEVLPPAADDGRVRTTPQRVDVLADPIPEGDILIANLFLHHLSDADAVTVLARMRERSRLGGAVFDLVRSRWAFWLLRIFLPAFARSPVTVSDGLTSVQQAFRRHEMLAMARAAGIERPRYSEHVGLRSLLWWTK